MVQSINELRNDVATMRRELEEMRVFLSQASKFQNYPKWITKKQAFEILPFKSWEKLRDSVSAGIIEAKTISDRGDLVYLKQHCLLYPERWEEYQRKKLIA